ncbi:kinase-like domain-containing protein [Rhizophagus irregularis DAOM 181602=DAOM 197198]|uniref:Kinase-like domain-containing protein n=1 Tax=Rhizophagus irregularis (strain DAOM 181602 / DAOM 197198 / MUCL 43194) TaxID=747089 RepID=A0A2H5TAN4_RHIID|nr:kinase-like domain-containing protein [Rhizophagus irregularis DAOM 181602=DAOM 197198]POG65887.1 kinase-like domain-containing protein [Rhizophagus irregularis DAOM 181602=DAOM 197198]|eukprot:XP_025172753.1 kinase-like domain-containing protein [Rhizophagus irregularis DAOM 181602=DAOM 197198]
MNQLNAENPNYRLCVQCKKPDESRYCRSCLSKNNEQKHGRCIFCKQIKTGKDWCQPCNSKIFQENFDNWTSGNDEIDNFIQNTQLSAKNHHQILEWIPYNRFGKPNYIAEGGFGKVYRASWKDGHITHWDTSCRKWGRVNSGSLVALKSLNNSQNVTLKFINEITLHLKVHEYCMSDTIIRCYGITQDPNTKNYIMVMYYAERGNLQNSLNKEKKKQHKKQKSYKFSNLDLNIRIWKHKINILKYIAAGLRKIHGKELIHRDLHIGNIVCNRTSPRITDLGLCKPANYNEGNNMMYGVLPYLAPEILRGQDYTKASDIYSFGIIMYVIISELPPYYKVAHDEFLALEICKGLRPEFNIKVPKLILHIIKSCLDADPSNRPDAKYLSRIFYDWLIDFDKDAISYSESINKTELIKQIEEAEQINNNSSTNSSPLTIHPEAIYKSRPFNYKNLTEPKNSDGYYEIYDNISTMKYSGNN